MKFKARTKDNGWVFFNIDDLLYSKILVDVIDEKTICRSIEKFDINGVELYENDVILFDIDSTETMIPRIYRNRQEIIEYNNTYCSFYPFGDSEGLGNPINVKFLRNIFD